MFTTNNKLCGEVSYVSASSMQEVVMHNSVLLGCVQNVGRPTSGKRIAIRCHGMTRFIPKRNSHWMLKSSHCQNAKNLQRYRTCTIFWTVLFCRKKMATVSIKIATVFPCPKPKSVWRLHVEFPEFFLQILRQKLLCQLPA